MASASQEDAEHQLREHQDPGAIPLQLNAAGEEVFAKGVGVHLWQSSGDAHSNWSHLLKSWRPLNFLRFALARLKGGPTVLEVCPNSWDRYDEDAGLAQGLGCNSFRLSLEWSRLEPMRGRYDMAAVQRYRDILDSLLRRGLTPNVTLSHFTLPQWFTDLGGFEKAENISLFVAYAVKAVRLFGDKVTLWATFNEPVSTAAMGYIFSAYPPARFADFTAAGQVLLNYLRAHTAAYRAIKALPGGDQHKVGVTHMMLPFSAWPDLGPFSAHARMFARWMDFIWGYDVVHNWVLTGRFTWYVPTLSTLSGARCVLDVQDPRPPLDWFGVQFYSRPVISLLLGPGRKPWQVNSDLGYPIDPEGLAVALQRASAYRVPLYVTELGVSIASPAHRCYAADASMKEILRALAQGIDVRGAYWWTLLDNFEWNAGYGIRFGLFAWSPWPWGQDRAKRSVADTLSGYYRNLPDSLAGTKAAAQAMDLSHNAHAPRPASVRWWLGTILLLALGLWGALLRSGLHAAFAALQLLCPAATAQLEDLQRRHQPPWKTVGGVPSSRASWQRSEEAARRAHASLAGSTAAGLRLAGVDGVSNGGGGSSSSPWGVDGS